MSGNINFGEKAKEYSAKDNKELPVWQSPKYIESKAKAIEIIESGKYGVLPSDFWILMNATKSGKMAYTGLIISHNGCLKINDRLESKFNPACVTLDKEGYNNSLVYTYCNPEQGIYEVGEVSKGNCKNEYPYAMAYKRMFDRVVLKLSKLAYAGIYSDSEADEFAQQVEAPETDMQYICTACGETIKPYTGRGGKTVSVEEHIKASMDLFGQTMCRDCCQKRLADNAQAVGDRAAEAGVAVNRS